MTSVASVFVSLAAYLPKSLARDARKNPFAEGFDIEIRRLFASGANLHQAGSAAARKSFVRGALFYWHNCVSANTLSYTGRQSIGTE